MKQKTLIPLIVFLLGICLVGIILYKIDSHETAQNHTTALLNATTYGERIKNEITEGIDVTDVLKQILISESGEFQCLHQAVPPYQPHLRFPYGSYRSIWTSRNQKPTEES